ncbi:MAG: methyltransferase domain-containing protein [Acidobacteriota bacterium]
MRQFFLATLATGICCYGQDSQAARGEQIFERSGCAQCHSVENSGGALGPDLSEAGIVLSPDSLRLAITNPSAEITRRYETVVAIPAAGKKVEGIALNEDDISIQMRTTDGNLRSFKKDDLRDLQREERSLMPSYANKLSPAEIDSLVGYLETLKGTHPAPGTPVRRTRETAGISENLEFLGRPERDEEEPPDELLDALQIPAGSAVADLGAGTGYFTWRLAERAGPQGKVIAVDIQQKMLDLVAKEVKQHGLHNVDLVLGGEHDPHLPENFLDLVLIAYAYHEFSQPEEIMAAVRRSLKRGGRVVLLEYALESAYTPVPGLHKMRLEDIRSEIEPMGFALDRVLHLIPKQHCVIFVKWPREQ